MAEKKQLKFEKTMKDLEELKVAKVKTTIKNNKNGKVRIWNFKA